MQICEENCKWYTQKTKILWKKEIVKTFEFLITTAQSFLFCFTCSLMPICEEKSNAEQTETMSLMDRNTLVTCVNRTRRSIWAWSNPDTGVGEPSGFAALLLCCDSSQKCWVQWQVFVCVPLVGWWRLLVPSTLWKQLLYFQFCLCAFETATINTQGKKISKHHDQKQQIRRKTF